MPPPRLLDRLLDAQMVCHCTDLVAYLGNAERDQLIADINTPWWDPGDFYRPNPGMKIFGMKVVFVNKKTWFQVTKAPEGEA